MSAKTAAGQGFRTTLDYTQFSKQELVELIDTAMLAYRNFLQIWQDAATNRFGEDLFREMTAEVYPTLSSHDGNLPKENRQNKLRFPHHRY